MRRGRASNTSNVVALMRAMADAGVTGVPGFSDPTALALLPGSWQLAGRALIRLFGRPGVRQAVYEQATDSWDLVPLRTRVLDDAWHAAHGAGVRQLVILGAGLDGRAFRLEDIADSDVFEVDHPATQQLKRGRSRNLTSRARRHIYVPVDFERDDFARALEEAGQRRATPSFFIWEGVTPYLSTRALMSTLRGVAERSAPGSRLAMEYIEPENVNVHGIGRIVRILGEPYVGLMRREVATDHLREAGIRVVDDSGPGEWRERYGVKPQDHRAGLRERIALAER